MGDILITLLYVVVGTLVICAFLGYAQARRDIRKNKNEDNKLRRSRKEIIKERKNSDIYISSCGDVLSAVSSLSDEQRAEFQRQLLAKFQEGSDR